MEKVELGCVDKVIYREILDNGLELIIIPNDLKCRKKNFYFNYGTYYGSLNNEFVPYNSSKMTKFPYGIAHFLEHKLFENENGESAFDYFSKTGCYANAFTSYKATCYVVTGNKNLKDNLKYLLNYVNKPYFTVENVKKEQGIIDEEIRMYDDDPDYVVFQTLYKNMFINVPYNVPIAGTCESIKKITKEKLYECYNTFYQPSNMFLVIGGAVDPEEIISIVTNMFATLNVKKGRKVLQKEYVEPIKVAKDYEQLKINAKVDKVALGYKMDRKRFTIKNNVLLSLYLNMIAALCFGNSSKFKEETREMNLVNRAGYYFQNLDNIIVFSIEADCFNMDVYLSKLENYLQNLDIVESDLERMKKVWISSEVIKSDYADGLVDSAVDDLINYHEVITNYVDLIRSMNINTMREVINSLDFTNKSIVKAYKN